MEFIWFACALALAWLPFSLLLARLVTQPVAGRGAILAGYGLLFGLLAVTLLLRLQTLLGVEFSLLWTGAPLALLLLGIVAWPAAATAAPAQAAAPPVVSRAEKWVFALCVALIVVRLVTLGMEALLRPAFAWDAKQHWTKQAQVFYEFGRVVPFVSPQQWLELGGRGVYANMHPDYPVTSPLLQVWAAMAVGEWRTDRVGLAWPCIYVGIGLVFYGQARFAGASAAVAAAAAYLVLSMPYLNIQVAMPGYADLLQGLVFLAAFAAFANWSRTREAWQAWLAVVAAAACPLVKQEGSVWLLCFLPGVVLAVGGLMRGVLVLSLLLLAVLVTLWVAPDDLAIAGHSLASMEFGYRAEALEPFYFSLVAHDNWHLLVYLGILMLVALLAVDRRALADHAAAGVVLISAGGLYLVLYLFTQNAYGAVMLTSVNRVGLHLMPALAFTTLLLYLALLRRSPRPDCDLAHAGIATAD